MSHPHHMHADPRDHLIPAEEVNATPHYVMYSVFCTVSPLHDPEAIAAEKTVLDTGVSIRGWYDIGGFRADADLMLWTLADNPHQLQAAYHALRRSDLGRDLEPVWSCIGVHRPAEFNRGHTPACFSGVAPRPWACVYPFVRSYDWYLLPDEERSRIMAEHGRNGFSKYPDVKGSTLATFGMSDYEWVLAFEADSLDRLEGVIHHQRYTEARLHVRQDTPFYTGSRVSPREWAERQPRA